MQDPACQDAMQKEAAKVLKKMGFPAIEAAVTRASLVPRALGCLTRRLAKVEEVLSELKEKI